MPGLLRVLLSSLLRLGKYFGTSPEIWLDLQSDYELRVARQTRWKTIDSLVRTRVA
jgi:plasmid maintenance system antidote protein VapI